MIYVLGDSCSFGYNFWQENKNHQELTYAYHLSRKLNMPFKNLSLPGGSNWRVARLLSLLSLSSDDIVIIGWTAIERYELPTSKTSLSPIDKVFDTFDDVFFKKPIPPNFMQWVEKTNNLYTRRLVFNSFNQQNIINNRNFEKLNKSLFKEFFDVEYFQQMFFILFKSCLYQLESSNAKFLMFNSWTPVVRKDEDHKKEYNVKQYLYGPQSCMTDTLRPTSPHVLYRSSVKGGTPYWDENEHEQISNILLDKLKEFYDIQQS